MYSYDLLEREEKYLVVDTVAVQVYVMVEDDYMLTMTLFDNRSNWMDNLVEDVDVKEGYHCTFVVAVDMEQTLVSVPAAVVHIVQAMVVEQASPAEHEAEKQHH